MHIHKIDSKLSEHQSFLAQNRKDPITGDSISDSDEVVFCVGCKSVFLKDTWEYIGKRHCEQYETLSKFPVQKAIQVKLENDILFYTSLPKFISGPKLEEIQDNIPIETKESPWIQTSQKTFLYQHIIHNPFIYMGSLLFCVFILLPLVVVIPKTFFAFYIALLALLFIFLLNIHPLYHWYFGQKIKSTYKNFTDNTFYITKKSIGFVSIHGFEEFILPAANITSIVFYEKNNLSSNSYCIVYYKINGIGTSMKFNVECEIFQTGTILFSALNTLSKSQNISVEIEINQENTLYHVQKMIANGNSNIRISII
ncbi:hypothetical protein [Bernardetia sp. MNP-M8]|uniref:hypothetical protein n=1 Tax=Bernardetia sp. MNP-M8 TaxID=3127470 RepID=UPI0030CE5888